MKTLNLILIGNNKKYLLSIIFLFLYFILFSQTIEVNHRYYTLLYDTTLKSPIISLYIQTTEHATSTVKIDRSTVASFHSDPEIKVKYQVATNKEYSSYNAKHRTDGLRKDKGHLSPYTAFDFDLVAAKESMFFTNTAPQASFFNEHPWEEIEQYILKKLAPKQDSIYVYTGCLYGEEKMNDVPIPDYYWKIIIYKNNGIKYCQAWTGKNTDTKDTNTDHFKMDLDGLKKLFHTYYPKIKLPFENMKLKELD